MNTCLSVSNLAVGTLGWGSSHCSKHLQGGVLFGAPRNGRLWSEKHICTFPKVCLAFMYTSSEKYPQTAFWKLTLLTIWLPKSLWSHRTTWKQSMFTVLGQKNKHTSPLKGDPSLWASELSLPNRGGWLVSRALVSITITPDWFFVLCFALSESHGNPLNACTHFLTTRAHAAFSELSYMSSPVI